MRKIVRLIPFFAIFGCGDTAPTQREKPFVAAVNYPLAFYAEQIKEDWAEVYFPIPEGNDPNDWKPDDKSKEKYKRAANLLTNGPGYAKWTQELGLPVEKCTDTTAAFKDQLAANNPIGLEQRGGCYWLDLGLCVEQWKVIEKSMEKSGHSSDMRRTQKSVFLPIQFMTRHLSFSTFTNRLRHVSFVASRPIYHYFASAYNLNLKSVQWKPDQVPTDEQIRELKSLLEVHPAKYMIWESKPVPAAVERVKTLGLESIVIDPCFARPSTGDFESVMLRNINDFKAALEKERP